MVSVTIAVVTGVNECLVYTPSTLLPYLSPPPAHCPMSPRHPAPSPRQRMHPTLDRSRTALVTTAHQRNQSTFRLESGSITTYTYTRSVHKKILASRVVTATLSISCATSSQGTPSRESKLGNPKLEPKGWLAPHQEFMSSSNVAFRSALGEEEPYCLSTIKQSASHPTSACISTAWGEFKSF